MQAKVLYSKNSNIFFADLSIGMLLQKFSFRTTIALCTITGVSAFVVMQ